MVTNYNKSKRNNGERKKKMGKQAKECYVQICPKCGHYHSFKNDFGIVKMSVDDFLKYFERYNSSSRG